MQTPMQETAVVRFELHELFAREAAQFRARLLVEHLPADAADLALVGDVVDPVEDLTRSPLLGVLVGPTLQVDLV